MNIDKRSGDIAKPNDQCEQRAIKKKFSAGARSYFLVYVHAVDEHDGNQSVEHWRTLVIVLNINGNRIPLTYEMCLQTRDRNFNLHLTSLIVDRRQIV